MVSQRSLSPPRSASTDAARIMSPNPLLAYAVTSAMARSTASMSKITLSDESELFSYAATTPAATPASSSMVTAMIAKGMLPRVSFGFMNGRSTRPVIKEDHCMQYDSTILVS